MLHNKEASFKIKEYIQPYLLTFKIVWACSAKLTLLQGLLSLLNSVLPVVILLLLQQVFNGVSEQLSEGVNDFGRLQPYFIGLAATFLFLMLSSTYGSLVDELHQQKIKDYLAQLVQEKTGTLEMSLFEDSTFHDVFFMVKTEAMHRPNQLVLNLRDLLLNATSLLMILIFLSFIHFSIGLILIASIIPATIIRVLYSHKIHNWKKASASMERKSDYLHDVLTTLSHVKEVRVFNLGELLKQRFRVIRNRLYIERLNMSKTNAKNSTIAKILEVGAEVLVYFIVIRQVLTGQVSFGDLAVLIQAFIRAKSNLTKTLQSTVQLNEHRLFLGHLHTLLNLKTEDLDFSKDQLDKLQTLDLENVCFKYPGMIEPAVSNINLSFKSGQLYAIVGENGSGKSTLTKLLCNLYRPNSGQILWNDKDITKVNNEQIISRISVCFQDFNKYHLSVKENVRLHKESDDLTRMTQALKQSSGKSLLDELPNGLDQQLGKEFEQGTDLSLGQWQKLAIARALYKDVDLLILDEPTSAIDPLSEATIFESIEKEARVNGKTVILVTHRLYNIKSVDQIIVMDQGKVINVGNHNQLMTNSIHYQRMFKKQAVGTLD